jgi:hypothetical protein
MRDNLTANLRHLTADQSADGKSDAEQYLRDKWYDHCGLFIFTLFYLVIRQDFTMNADLWHKVYPMTKDWKVFVNQRQYARGPLKYPFLQKLWKENKFPAHFFKSWWVNVSEVCPSIQVYSFHFSLYRLVVAQKLCFVESG